MADFGVGETALTLEAADATAEALPVAEELGTDYFSGLAGTTGGSALPGAVAESTSAMAPAQAEISAQNLANVTGQAQPLNVGSGVMQQVSGGPQSFESMAHAGQTLTDEGYQAANSFAPGEDQVANQGIQQISQNTAPSSLTAQGAAPSGATPGQVIGNQVVGSDNQLYNIKDLPADVQAKIASQSSSGIGQFLSDYKNPLLIGGGMLGINALVQQGNRQYGIPAQTHYTGPLSQFKYSPTSFTPTYPTPNPYVPRYAQGGITELNVGGKLLKGQGDGMSDGIKANIAGKQEARLADGEFVVPADVVSHLGNGSTDAGAKQLYSMMDKVRQARVGTKKQGKEINPKKYMPA